jgi:cysteinyl-tRNA synthetase
MDDDLGTPAAVAAIHNAVREGNTHLATAEKLAGQVRAMLAALGLDPADPSWSTGAASGKAEGALAAAMELVMGQRAQARAEKDWTTADAIRDALGAAGVEVEDTPDGPKWSLI